MSTPPVSPTNSPFAARTGTRPPMSVPGAARTGDAAGGASPAGPTPVARGRRGAGGIKGVIAISGALLLVAAGAWWWLERAEADRAVSDAPPAKTEQPAVMAPVEPPEVRGQKIAKEFAALQERAAGLELDTPARAAMAEATLQATQAQAFAAADAPEKAVEAWIRAVGAAGPAVLARVTALHDAESASLGDVQLENHSAPSVQRLAQARAAADEAARRGAWAEAVKRRDDARSYLAPARKAVAAQLTEAAAGAAGRGDEALATLFHERALRLDATLEASRAYLYQHKFKAGQMLRTSGGMELAYAPPGEFMRGSPGGEAGRDADETPHKVRLSKGFFLAVCETTQRDWDRVFGPDAAARTLHAAKAKPETIAPDLPMHSVTWAQAEEYCRRLSDAEGLAFRLPTEAEWEYACRAGKTTAFNLGVDGLSAREANIDDGSAAAPLAPRAPGVSGPANVWGLRDMHGNVWEWCADWSAPYPKSGDVSRDPAGPARETLGRIDLALKVVRGGGWNAPANDARSANRWEYSPAVATGYIGLRVAHDPDPAKP